MKRTLYFLLAVFFPWFIFLMHDMPAKAFLAFMLQASLIGWIFSTIWAWRLMKVTLAEEALEKTHDDNMPMPKH